MGAVSDAIASSARSLRRRDPHRGARSRGSSCDGGAATRRRARGGEELAAPLVVTAIHPKITFLEQLDRVELPADFVDDIENWKTRSGVVKINCRARPRAGVHRDARAHRPHRAASSSRTRSPTSRGRSRRRAPGEPATAPFSDGVMPTVYDRTLAPEGKHVVSLFTQWVPHEWSEEPHTERARGLRRPRDRRLRRAGAGLRRLRAAPPGDRPLRDGAGVGADRRQHLPRGALRRAAVPHAAGARATPTTARRSAGCTSARAPRTAGGGVCGIPAYNCVREIKRTAARGASARKG